MWLPFEQVWNYGWGGEKYNPPPAQKKNEVRNIVSTAAQRENAGQFGTDSL